MAEVRILEILLHDTVVGTYTLISGDRSYFALDESFMANELRLTLGQTFEDEFGEPITEFRTTQTRLMPFFSNLLPEGRLRTYLAELAGVSEVREFFLLATLGSDLPGAITARLVDDESWLVDVDDHNGDLDLKETGALRFSLAGVQLKFSAFKSSKRGFTIPAHGVGGSWIVKFPPSQFQGVAENEFSMMTLAGFIGMDVPNMELVYPSMIENLPEEASSIQEKALAIQRFDRREDGSHVHIEDFAQVFNVYPEKKYEKANMRNIASVVGTVGTDVDIAELIRRLTFNTLIGNADMHLKNWSLIYPDGRQAALAPAYDFLSTIPYISDNTAALNVSRNKRFDQFTEDELSHLANKAGLSNRLILETARETVELFYQYWNSEKVHLPLSENVVQAIDLHLKKVPIAN